MINKILYIFLSHQGNISSASPRINLMMKEKAIKDYILIVGGHKETSYDPHTKILSVCSSDLFEVLPEKVFYSYKFISKYHLF